LSDPLIPTGPWKCKSGRLCKRYSEGIKKQNSLDVRSDNVFNEFVERTKICEDVLH